MRVKRMVFFRTVFFMPVIYPMALVSVVWALILAPGPVGIMNQFLRAITIGAWNPTDFLRHPTLAMPAIMMMSLWQGVGYQMVCRRRSKVDCFRRFESGRSGIRNSTLYRGQ
jgi:multiple sugar transport system permease protein